MAKIHSGQDIVSLFISSIRQKQFKGSDSKTLSRQRGVYAILGAFLIVIIGAMVLNFISQKLELSFAASAYQNQEIEKVAFQPGMFVTEKLQAGYLSR